MFVQFEFNSFPMEKNSIFRTNDDEDRLYHHQKDEGADGDALFLIRMDLPALCHERAD
jgi:hypothetical protein